MKVENVKTKVFETGRQLINSWGEDGALEKIPFTKLDIIEIRRVLVRTMFLGIKSEMEGVNAMIEQKISRT